MTTLREAAQAALESLQELNGWQSLAPPAASRAAVQAAINLSAALAEPVQETGVKLKPVFYAPRRLDDEELEAALQRLTDVQQEIEAALAEPVQEPQEPYWYVGPDGEYYSSNEVKLFMDAKTRALYKDPPQWRLDYNDLIPLYTAPPQRKPLTEECSNCASLQDQNTELDRKLAELQDAVMRGNGVS